MASNTLKTIDLFSGAGGLSSGLKYSGFQICGAIESNKAAAKTHALNFNDCKTIHGDIREYPPEKFSELTNLSPGQIDVLTGGPPCQTFSSIGKPKINSLKDINEEKKDPRNYLFRDFFNYVEFFRPKFFVMENVPAIKTKYKGKLFERILDVLSEMDYEITLSVLNACEYGVPQLRKRIFIVGSEKGTKFTFKQPTHFDKKNSSNPLSKNGVFSRFNTVNDAISDLPKIYDGCRLGDLDYKTGPQSNYQKLIRSKSGKVGNNICRMSNERAKKVFRYMKQGDKYMDLPPEIRRILPFREDIFHDRLKRLELSKPSWTVIAHIGMDGYMYIHPTETRTLSVREAARLQSFNDEFKFVGNMREQYVQVGNAVPPLLGKAIGDSILSCA
tara:strand:- start:2342 stop:3502 length:1161 start_codon:yes stop_codon:yes gene_type:complete